MKRWVIREGTHDDLDAVLALWARAEVVPTVTDSIEPLRRLLDRDPRALLLAHADEELVGSLIAAWNGWRGSFYRLAVAPQERRRGLATLLVREGERLLRERGAIRLDAIVPADEAAATGFWTALGYAHQAAHARFIRDF